MNDGKVSSIVPKIARKQFIEAMSDAAIEGGYSAKGAFALLIEYTALAYYLEKAVDPTQYLKALRSGPK